MLQCLQDIQDGRGTKIPVYDFKSNSRCEDKFSYVHPADVVLVEGILIFYSKEVRDMFDMKLFVDTDADTYVYILYSINIVSHFAYLHSVVWLDASCEISRIEAAIWSTSSSNTLSS